LHVNEEIQVWCTLKKVTTKLKEAGLNVGDKILLFQSLRPSMGELMKDIRKANFENFVMFDIGTSFVGVLLKKPPQNKYRKTVG